jgi:hypothetical protein
MSAFGGKADIASGAPMSAFDPKADMAVACLAVTNGTILEPKM